MAYFSWPLPLSSQSVHNSFRCFETITLCFSDLRVVVKLEFLSLRQTVLTRLHGGNIRQIGQLLTILFAHALAFLLALGLIISLNFQLALVLVQHLVIARLLLSTLHLVLVHVLFLGLDIFVLALVFAAFGRWEVFAVCRVSD